MAMSLVELFREAGDLDEHDRAALAGLLLESLETEPDPDVEVAWTAEIDRRMAQIDAGEVELVPWEELKDKLFRDSGRKR